MLNDSYRTFPQFLQKRSEEAFNVPQSGQYHLPSGIGSTGEGVWCAFAGVLTGDAVNNGAIFTSLRPTPARLLKSHDLTSCANVRFDSIYRMPDGVIIEVESSSHYLGSFSEKNDSSTNWIEKIMEGVGIH